MRISVIIPVFNEQETILDIVKQVIDFPLTVEKEIVIVNDGSTDLTLTKINSMSHPALKVFSLEKNLGKGAAVRTGIAQATGDIILIQDADLEYSPEDYPYLLKPILDNKADVVFGTRLQGGSGPHRVMFFWHYLGNKMLTTLSNMFTNLNLTDMEVGFKVFRSTIVKSLKLKENRFGFEPEVTAKIAKLHCRIYEVPVSYYGRTYKEGKKISWKDGFSALRCIIKYSFF